MQFPLTSGALKVGHLTTVLEQSLLYTPRHTLHFFRLLSSSFHIDLHDGEFPFLHGFFIDALLKHTVGD